MNLTDALRTLVKKIFFKKVLIPLLKKIYQKKFLKSIPLGLKASVNYIIMNICHPTQMIKSRGIVLKI